MTAGSQEMHARGSEPGGDVRLSLSQVGCWDPSLQWRWGRGAWQAGPGEGVQRGGILVSGGGRAQCWGGSVTGTQAPRLVAETVLSGVLENLLDRGAAGAGSHPWGQQGQSGGR